MKKYYIANWKMKMGREATVSFIKKIKNKKFKNAELILAPSFPFLFKAKKEIGTQKIGLAAQNIAAWEKGAFTGEVSAKMIKEVGCKYVIIGHSERRGLLGETDYQVNQKMSQALKVGLTPILCIGETLDQKKAGKRDIILLDQIKQSLAKIENLTQKKIIIAYEPVWAISTSGTGILVTPEDLDEAYKVIKRAVSTMCSSAYFEDKVKFIYGGSVDAQNVDQFKSIPYLHGFLIGGASLKVDDFVKVIEA